MGKFLGGFAAASVLWVGAAAVYYFVFHPSEPSEQIRPAVVAAEEPEESDTDSADPRRRRRGKRGAGGGAAQGSSGARTPTGEATTGDDLGEGEARTLDLGSAGGEAQLTGAQIETTFDGGFGRIRRCLVLAAGDEVVRGRVVFGLRVAGSGEVRAVNLSGPAAVTTGEAGDCLRTAARGLRFPSFDGPEMVVRYPITLE